MDTRSVPLIVAATRYTYLGNVENPTDDANWFEANLRRKEDVCVLLVYFFPYKPLCTFGAHSCEEL